MIANRGHEHPFVLSVHQLADAEGLHRAAEAQAAAGAEVLAVHTCQRCELYRLADREPGPAALPAPLTTGFNGGAGGAGGAAVERLFALACGGLSDVPGERAIAEQLETALRAARRLGWCGARLGRLVEEALSTAETVRERVERATPILELADLVAGVVRDDLARAPAVPGEEIIVLGAGPVACAARHALAAAGVEVTAWATRRPSPRRGAGLRLDEAVARLPRCRVLVSALAHSRHVVDSSELPAGALAIDLAVPANVRGRRRCSIEDVVARSAARLAPQRRALAGLIGRLPDLARHALATLAAPSIGPVADSIERFRESVADMELARLAAVLERLPEAEAERVRRAIRRTTARCAHPLHDYVNRLRREHRLDDAAGLRDALEP